MLWDGYLALQMANHRLTERTRPRGRKFSFQTDPTDFTEIGQAYRRKSIRVEVAILAWSPIIPIALAVSSGI
jgi:hypothetical protein